ncbi:MAG: hypothetical protein K2X86_17760 [Cytophagaceae bacterium]|nr:hypothetical protein [Cytophagaceae bacterium]
MRKFFIALLFTLYAVLGFGQDDFKPASGDIIVNLVDTLQLQDSISLSVDLNLKIPANIKWLEVCFNRIIQCEF